MQLSSISSAYVTSKTGITNSAIKTVNTVFSSSKTLTQDSIEISGAGKLALLKKSEKAASDDLDTQYIKAILKGDTAKAQEIMEQKQRAELEEYFELNNTPEKERERMRQELEEKIKHDREVVKKMLEEKSKQEREKSNAELGS